MRSGSSWYATPPALRYQHPPQTETKTTLKQRMASLDEEFHDQFTEAFFKRLGEEAKLTDTDFYDLAVLCSVDPFSNGRRRPMPFTETRTPAGVQARAGSAFLLCTSHMRRESMQTKSRYVLAVFLLPLPALFWRFSFTIASAGVQPVWRVQAPRRVPPQPVLVFGPLTHLRRVP